MVKRLIVLMIWTVVTFVTLSAGTVDIGTGYIGMSIICAALIVSAKED